MILAGLVCYRAWVRWNSEWILPRLFWFRNREIRLSCLDPIDWWQIVCKWDLSSVALSLCENTGRWFSSKLCLKSGCLRFVVSDNFINSLWRIVVWWRHKLLLLLQFRENGNARLLVIGKLNEFGICLESVWVADLVVIWGNSLLRQRLNYTKVAQLTFILGLWRGSDYFYECGRIVDWDLVRYSTVKFWIIA